jgi:putative transposase
LQGRFKSILVEKESYLLELVRYVVLNPVRAEMVRLTKDWKWSSYRATSGQAEVPDFLTVEWILSQFDPDLSRAQKVYRRFVRQGRGVDIWSEPRHGNLLGSESFDEQLQPLLEERRTEIDIRRTERLATRPSLDKLFADVHDKPTRNERIHRAMRMHEYTLEELSDPSGFTTRRSA